MAQAITGELVFSHLSKREKNTSKYDYGTLLAVCGSEYYRGAAHLASKAACRCGAGIVCLASTERVILSCASAIPECTFLPLSESKNGTVSAKAVPAILDRAKNCKAILIGCGLALNDDTREVVRNVVEAAECQLVLDADALNVLAECPDLLKKTKRPPVITPHFREMARLCGKSREDIEKEPKKTAIEFAREYNCIVVLKSHITYVATPDGKCFVNANTGNPGLARGGSGDVLAGMISSLIAQGKSPITSACCGVYIHGLAADRCAQKYSETAMLPSDVINELCAVFKEIGK